MTDIAIKVEDLSKLYRLGEIGTGTLSHDLNRWFAKIRGREDPFAKVSQIDLQENDNTSPKEIWALRDINFEVKKGEVLGIIGRNGAGKSTLLKILSKITKPTTGKIKLNGKIASLLEVGTGFHQEMTGRENIFLNGAILGMTRTEIKSKFDEIVEFSGVEKFIDTPVKRYSSGMYVRLAFAVAAHLEPDILIVDEVLAVGDAAFQNKCIGKMKDVSERDGRTVLFVSHNMAAMQSLCNKGLLLDFGKILINETIESTINKYLSSTNNQRLEGVFQINDKYFDSIRVLNSKWENTRFFLSGEKMYLEIKLKNKIQFNQFVGLGIYILCNGQNVAGDTSFFSKTFNPLTKTILYEIPFLSLTPDNYSINISLAEKGHKRLSYIENAGLFSISANDIYQSGEITSKALGVFYLNGKWT